MSYIRWFSQVTLRDVELVGGKNALLGEMVGSLVPLGIKIPDGFAVTVQAYWAFIDANALREGIQKELTSFTNNSHDLVLLKKVSAQVQHMLQEAEMPKEVGNEIVAAYHELSSRYGHDACAVAVRSSATAEDLPGASFAGQQESFLNVAGDQALLAACKNCFASLFTERAIMYRTEKGFDHLKVGLSLGVQKMVRSDRASSGVLFTLDTESGFKDVVTISASYGLGESIVQGLVVPDEYIVFKPTLEQGYHALIQKTLGNKETKIVYAGSQKGGVNSEAVPVAEQQVFALADHEVLELARQAVLIERHYSNQAQQWVPMDIEWAKDGNDGHLYIVQARPETVQVQKNTQMFIKYSLKDPAHAAHNIIITGQSIGQKIVSGTVRLIEHAHDLEHVKEDDIIVTTMTDPDWVPIMKKAKALVTDRGGRTCHAAIVSRELGLAAIVGTERGTKVLKNGQTITVDCSQGSTGYIYQGTWAAERTSVALDDIKKPPVSLMISLADPNQAFELSFLPADGIGLARIEFIMSNIIKVHPMALVDPEKITDPAVQKQIKNLTQGYSNYAEYFIDKLAQGIGTLAAAMYPRPVIVRFSDFKSNEYRTLLGGSFFELQEENPMLGFRGACRYSDERYKAAFLLECAALRNVRELMGLVNVKVMVPFVRTIQELDSVLRIMAENGLPRGHKGLEVLMMVELPSNVLLIEEFASLVDGFSIGSNDLTQLVLGVDRDSALVHKLFDERDQAVKKMLALAIQGARKAHKTIGICGQGPSDYPELADFLIEQGISSLSFNPDALLPFMTAHSEQRNIL